MSKLILPLVLALAGMAPLAAAETNGIENLNNLAQVRANNANDAALSGAERSRDEVREQRRRHGQFDARIPPVQTSAQAATNAPPLSAGAQLNCKVCGVSPTSGTSDQSDGAPD